MSYEPKNKLETPSNNLANSLNEAEQEDVEMIDSELEKHKPQGNGVGSFIKEVVSGKYQYLTYLITSMTCIFFYMTPNCHKFRGFYNYPKTYSQVGKAGFPMTMPNGSSKKYMTN